MAVNKNCTKVHKNEIYCVVPASNCPCNFRKAIHLKSRTLIDACVKKGEISKVANSFPFNLTVEPCFDSGKDNPRDTEEIL